MKPTKPGSIESIWKKKGGRLLSRLYEQRKKRDNFSIEKMGEFLGYHGTSRVNATRGFLSGNTRLKPFQILLFADGMSKTEVINPDEQSNLFIHADTDTELNFHWLSALIATYSGQISPLIIELLDKDHQPESILQELASINAALTLFGNLPETNLGSALSFALQEIRAVSDRWINAYLIQKKISEEEFISLDELGQLVYPGEAIIARAYSFAQIVKKFNKAGAGNNINPQIEQMIANLKGSGYDSVILWPIICDLYISAGDRSRKNGVNKRSSIIKAIEYYDLAKESIHLSSKNSYKKMQRIKLKTFNTLLIGRLLPPDNDIAEVMHIAKNEHSPPKLQARAWLSIAWLQSSRRGERLKEANNIRAKAREICHKHKYKHLEAVCYQNFADDHLHLGQLNAAKDAIKEALSRFAPINHGRIGYTHFLYARCESYKMLSDFYLSPEKVDLDKLLSLYGKARVKYSDRSEVQESDDMGYQGIQLELETEKWRAVFSHLTRKQNENRKHDFKEALATLGTAHLRVEQNDFLDYSLRVNTLICHFMGSFSEMEPIVEMVKIKDGALDELSLIKSALQSDNYESNHNDDYFPIHNIHPIKSSMAGHMSRLNALLAAVEYQITGSGTNTDYQHYIELALNNGSRYDFLAILDSLLIMMQTINSDVLVAALNKFLLPATVQEIIEFFPNLRQ